jgi:hypothetical protein
VSNCSELDNKTYCFIRVVEFADQLSDYYVTMRNMHAKLEVPTAVLLKIQVGLDMTVCSV